MPRFILTTNSKGVVKKVATQLRNMGVPEGAIEAVVTEQKIVVNIERENFEYLHCIQHVERVMIEVKVGDAGKVWEEKGKVAKFTAAADFSLPLLVWRDIHHREPKSWTLDAKKRAAKHTPLHEASKILLQDQARKGLHESLTSTHGIEHSPKSPDILVYLHITEKTLLLTIPVLSKRQDPPSLRVSKGLHHTVAWGVARTACLLPGEWVLDPCVGKGGLILESESWWPACKYVGVDNDAEQLAHAAENLKINNSKAAIMHGSCTKLPFRPCFDVVISDLPFGRSCGTPEGNKALYPALLASLNSSMTDSGRAVLLTGEESADTLQAALESSGFITVGTAVFQFGGNKNKLQCYMFSAVKKTHPDKDRADVLKSLFDWRFAEKLKQNKDHSWRNEKPSMVPYRAKAHVNWGAAMSLMQAADSFAKEMERALDSKSDSTHTQSTPGIGSGTSSFDEFSSEEVSSSDMTHAREDEALLQQALDAAKLNAKIASCEKTNNEIHSRLIVTEEQLKQSTSRCVVLKDELAQLRSEKLAMESAYKNREEKMAHITEETRTRLEKIEREDHLFRENIKDTIHQQLFIGKETGAVLAARRPENLDLIEYIQLTVHNKISERYKTIEEDSQQLTEIVRDLERARSEVSRLGNLLEDEREKCRQMEADSGRKTSRYEEKIQRLESELDGILNQMEADRETTRNAFKIKEDLVVCREQIVSLETENVELGKKVQLLEKSLDKAKNNLDTDVEKAKHATTEMRYLTRENETLSSRVKVLEEEKQHAGDRSKALQEQHAENLDKYSKDLLDVRERHDERLRVEAEKIQENATKEIKRIREHTQALADRENSQLKTEKELAVQEADRANRKAQEAEGELKQYRIEYKMTEEALKTEVATLRADLRVKSLEAQQLQVIRDQQESTMHHLHMEAECTQKKLDTLKAEFYELQMQNSRSTGELQARISGYKEQLKIYEDLEAECDNAIEQTGRQLQGEGHSGRAATILNQVPSSSGRRIQQSLLLAQRAMKLETEILSLNEQLTGKIDMENGLRAELNRVKGVMGNQGQPYQYFVDTLERKDAEIESLKREATGKRVDTTMDEQEREENNRLREVVSSLSMQLETLKQQRDDLSKLLQEHLEASKKHRRHEREKTSSRESHTQMRRRSTQQGPIRQEKALRFEPPPVHGRHTPPPVPEAHPQVEGTSVFTQPFLISA